MTGSGAEVDIQQRTQGVENADSWFYGGVGHPDDARRRR